MNSVENEDSTVPKGWILCSSKSNPGRKYYFNRKTGKSSWTKPQDNESSTEKQKKKRAKEKEKEQINNIMDNLLKVNKEPQKKNMKRKSAGSSEGSCNKQKREEIPTQQIVRQKLCPAKKPDTSVSLPSGVKKATPQKRPNSTVVSKQPTKVSPVKKLIAKSCSPNKVATNYHSKDDPSTSSSKSSVPVTPKIEKKNIASARMSRLRAELSSENVEEDRSSPRKSPNTSQTESKQAKLELKSPNMNDSKCSIQSPNSDTLQSAPSPSQFFAATKIISSMKAQLPEEYNQKVKQKDTFADIEQGICNQTTEYPYMKHPSTPPQFSEASKLVSAIKSKLSYKSSKDMPVTFNSAKDRLESLRRSLGSEAMDTNIEKSQSSMQYTNEAMDVDLKETKQSAPIKIKVNVTSSKENIVLVVDTNIFIQELDFIKNVMNSHIKGFTEPPTLLVPWRVINELDKLKDSNNGNAAICKRARPAMNYLYKYLPENNRIKVQPLRDANSHIYPCESPDDEILNCCLQQAERGKSVILLSNDKNLCSKAVANGVQNRSLRELELEPTAEPHAPPDEAMRVQKHIYTLLANILENEMRAKYDNIWLHVVFKPPPWQLRDVLQCLLKHWVAVFHEVFPRIEHLITEVKDCLVGIEKKESKNITQSELSNFKDLCLDVAKHCQIIPEYMELAKKTVARLQRDRASESDDEPDKDGDNVVIEAFEGVWTVFSSYCAKLATFLGISHNVEDKLPSGDTLDVLIDKLDLFGTHVSALTTAITGAILNDAWQEHRAEKQGKRHMQRYQRHPNKINEQCKPCQRHSRKPYLLRGNWQKDTEPDIIMALRLIFRHQKLKQATLDIQAMVTISKSGSQFCLSEEDLITSRVTLQHMIEAFDKEFRSNSDLESEEFARYMEDQSEAEKLLISLNSAFELFKMTRSRGLSSAKLPKLEWEKYRGDILKFNEFWDKFQANVDSKDLPDVEKLSYLLSSLEGPALETISGISTTNANYAIAVDTLRAKYGSKDRVIDAHYKAMNSIKEATENHQDCRRTLDSVEKHLRILQTLGEDMENNHLRVNIASKFPNSIMYQVNLLSPDEHSVSTLRSNLSRVITAMERSGAPITQCSSGTITPSATTEALQVRSEPAPKRMHKRRWENITSGPPTKRAKLPCLFCNMSNHGSSDCRKVKSVEARKAKLKDRCLLCLRKNHSTEECKRKISCFRCKENHLKMLCPNQKSKEGLSPVYDTTTCNTSNELTYLQTAVVTMQNPDNNEKKEVRLLLDCGSQRSYITTKAANSIGLSTSDEDHLLIYTFGAESPVKMSSPASEVIIETKRGIKRKITVNIVPRITDRVPVAKWQHERIDILADDDSVGKGVDILVGNDVYCSFMRDDRIQVKKNLYLIDTDFGWILSGNNAQKETDVLSVATYCQCHTQDCPYFTQPDLPLRNIDIKFLWSLESIGITDSPKATRQEQAISHFNNTVLYQNGRYEVKWPWIQYPPDLISNFGLALGRLRSLIKRLDTDSLSEYNNILKEQMDLGIIEAVEPYINTEDHPVHYLPHHMVKQKDKRGRIVYDASAKVTGQKSLNECLYSGPSMLEDLTGLLLKFRTKQVGMVADVEKAFLQVGLQQDDRDVTRFLWLKDPKKEVAEENLLHFRFCRVPFGVISSPFLLTATIRHHMSQTGIDMLKHIADRCYVDNLVTGADTIQEASKVYDQTRSSFEQLSMNIRDWVSNKKEFMEMIPQQHRATNTAEVKVLGLKWDTQQDTLKLRVSEENFNPKTPIQTKRDVLRTLARVYDPCGFVCPLILPIKLLFQKICQEKVKWDTLLPEHLMKSLSSTLEKLKRVTEVEIPRYIGVNTTDGKIIHDLQCFTDASGSSYAAVVFLRSQDETKQQKATVSFVMAKSRVAQIQDKDNLKIPKLELLGFLIGSRLLKYVKANLDIPIEKQYLWTDSLVVLGWMNSNKLLPPFVANRVNEIKRNQTETEMFYIHTKSNPADIATRPEPELWDQRKELWYEGPAFLKEDVTCWPDNRHYVTHRTLFSSGKALEGSSGEGEPCDWSEVEAIPDVTMEIDDPSSNNDRRDKNTYNSPQADIIEMKKLQSLHFPNEQAGKKTHLTKNLNLFLDIDGLLRCGGRMANTTWSYDMKYPILLPKDSEFTNQVIMKIHKSNYHVGAAHTLNIIREKYWIPQGKAKVTKLLKICKQCVKHGGGPYKLPNAPPLPPERVNYYEPFSFAGLDYFGPVFVNTPNGQQKRWVAIYTCLTVRAISLEIVKNLSAEECLLALRRLAATRGVPKKIYSDNAACFKLTSEVMTKPYCIDNKIDWKFIPELAPWHGGYYERLIGLVKHCLKRTLGKHLLNDNQLLTVMKEVEAVVNTRPLTRVGTEIEHILRPTDFLTLGKCLITKQASIEIPHSGSKFRTDLINSWKRGQTVLEEFKKMFVVQYLTSLRERTKHTPKEPRIRSERVPQVGDLVQIKADNKNRLNWKVGKIVDLLKGADGECRVARVKVDDSVYTRSIGHLYPLEEDMDEITPSGGHGTTIAQEEEDHTQTNAPILSPCTKQNETAVLPGSVYQTETQPLDASEEDYSCANNYEGSVTEEDAPVDTSTDYRVTVIEEHVPVEITPELETTDSSNAAGSQDSIRVKRDAAIKAREKILKWTRQLLALLK